MLLRSTPALLLLFLPHSFVVSQSTYQYDDGALLFNRSAAPPGWRLARDSRPKRSDSFHGGLTIPLNHADGGAAVTNAVAQRSDPESVLFQHWLTQAEVIELIKPSPNARDALNVWLIDQCGIDAQSIDRSRVDAWVIESCSIAQVECLFSTTMALFQRIEGSSSKFHLAAIGPASLPLTVREFIPFVPGLSDFPLPSQGNRKAQRQRNPRFGKGIDKGAISPKTIASLYNLPSSSNNIQQQQRQSHSHNAPGGAGVTTLLVAEFLSEHAYKPENVFGASPKPTKSNPSFFSQAGMADPVGGQNDITVVGAFTADDGELEATLDIEYAYAMALLGAAADDGAEASGKDDAASNAIKLVYWTEARWMFTFASSFFAGTGTVSAKSVDVVSISFSWSEASQCTQPDGSANPTCTQYKMTSAQYVARTNVEFAKIGALGTTIVVSSGDEGALGNLDKCKSGAPFDPGFPASSPHVLTVGATMLSASVSAAAGPAAGAPSDPICKDNGGCATSKDEVVCSYPYAGITSGGGFSHFAPRPAWQDTAVSTYLKNAKLPPSSMYNASGRGFPDISVVGHNYAVYFGAVGGSNFWIPTDGTSCSTPAVAGMLASIIARLGHKRLGLIAPLLYAMPSSTFHDVTVGSNKCSSTCCGDDGFAAIAGWDAVTGLGSPDFTKLEAELKKVMHISYI